MFPIFAATSNNDEGLIRRSRKDQVFINNWSGEDKGEEAILTIRGSRVSQVISKTLKDHWDATGAEATERTALHLPQGWIETCIISPSHRGPPTSSQSASCSHVR